MELRFDNELSVEEYNLLRESVGWGELCHEQVFGCVNSSDYIVACRDQDSIVGAARLFWDKGYIAYVSDVMVKPEYQGQGIGSLLVKKCVEYIDSVLKPGWRIKIVLLSSKGNESFYERLGFNSRPNDKYGSGMDMWRKWRE